MTKMVSADKTTMSSTGSWLRVYFIWSCFIGCFLLLLLLLLFVNTVIFLSRIVEFDVNDIHILLYKRARFAEIYWYNNNSNNNNDNNNNNKENNNKRKYGEN